MLQQICQHHSLSLLNAVPVSGGDINKAWQLTTQQGQFFIKLNAADRFPGMLAAEAKGLELLTTTNTFKIPAIVAQGNMGDTQYLVLEWIETAAPHQKFWALFGEKLAALHRHAHPCCGLPFDNYIGSLKQSNTEEENFAHFYAVHRIMPLVEKLVASKHFSESDAIDFRNLCVQFPNLIPEEPPALLHGDLWAGNYLVDVHGLPVLIDPAPYYGHREMDMAMTRLFGGFDSSMYHAYHYHFPLQAGWEARVPIFQLYPLLVHAVLFGSGYVQQCRSIVKSLSF